MTALIDENYSLIPPGDPRYFSQTCFKPYDRHKYKLIFTNGRTVVYDDYMDCQAAWFQTSEMFLGHVEVLDRKSKYR